MVKKIDSTASKATKKARSTAQHSVKSAAELGTQAAGLKSRPPALEPALATLRMARLYRRMSRQQDGAEVVSRPVLAEEGADVIVRQRFCGLAAIDLERCRIGKPADDAGAVLGIDDALGDDVGFILLHGLGVGHGVPNKFGVVVVQG